METTMRTLQITIPSVDASFLNKLAKKMGWQVQTTKKSGLQKAIEDVQARRVYEAKDVEDLFAQLNA